LYKKDKINRMSVAVGAFDGEMCACEGIGAFRAANHSVLQCSIVLSEESSGGEVEEEECACVCVCVCVWQESAAVWWAGSLGGVVRCRCWVGSGVSGCQDVAGVRR